MKKLALLAVAALGLVFMAQTCIILGATVIEIDGEVRYSAEMENESAADLLNHKFAVGFIEGQSAVFSETVDGCLRSLQSGASNFYTSNSHLEDDEVDTAVSRLVGPLTFGEVVEGDISFVGSIDATHNTDEEELIVNGRIRNDGNDDLDDVRVCVVVRNKDGDVTMVQHDNNEYDGFDPDDTQDFSVTVEVTDETDDVDTVDLWVDARNADEDDRVTEPQSDLNNNVEECDEPTNTPTNTPTGSPAPTETPTPDPSITPTATPTKTSTPLPDAC